ncbi:hypothetical protein BZA05DRAFT_402713 [Tricharina praecox]|uniref:uncharacterized protein n=1 Tax=Tricharina praecox TaxID=43433 RepID=UPI00221EE559|nr:uncharacterized protein BZA05DRAFT_402713 [Tricharina praecox]KAI5848788.1 hypothetical protein BZA05DRAFT_402713 [Tricharina praecox]
MTATATANATARPNVTTTTTATVPTDVPTGLQHHNPLVDDVAARNGRLTADRDRLFAPEQISIDTLDVNLSAEGEQCEVKRTWTDAAEFSAQCLQQPTHDSRYYILKPFRPKVISRSPLHITEEAARQLLATHEVMPSFLDHLHAYGRRKNREQDGCFGGGRYLLGFSEESKVTQHEIAYTVKFGVNNGRKEETSPYLYSIRQTSVYQKFCYDERKSVWILVQPSDAVQRRLYAAAPKEVVLAGGNPLKMHLLFFSAASEGWRDYYNHLEKIFYETTAAAVNYTVQRSNEKYTPQGMQGPQVQHFEGTRGDPLEKFQVDFQDVQDLQRLEELLRRVKTAIEVNSDSIRSLKALNNKLRELSSATTGGMTLAAWSEVDIEASQQLAILESHKRNFESLLQNVHGRSQLLYNVLDFKNALTVSHHSQRAVDIRALQANEQTMMTMLNEMSMRDAIGVRILTLLATLYVPASFVATFLDAGVVTFDETRSTKAGIDFSRMRVSRETTVFYLVFTTLLMAITYGCWWLWQRTATGQVEKKLSITRANSMEPEKGLLRSPTAGTAGSNPMRQQRRLGSLLPISPQGTHHHGAPPPMTPVPMTPMSPTSPMSPMSPMSTKSRSTWA